MRVGQFLHGLFELMRERALVKSTSDRKQLKEAARREKDIRERDLNDLRELLELRPGRRFLWKMLSAAGVFQQSYTGDDNATNFNEGRRSIGLRLLDELTEADPGAYGKLVQESRADEFIGAPEPLDKTKEENTND